MTQDIVLVVARAKNGVIGRDGALPWHLPEDLKRFKTLTMGTAMIMGRRTFESLPGILPGRRHIVISRNRQWSAHGAEAAATPEAALETAGSGSVSVIGGAEIFRAFEPHAHRIELTEVHDEPEGDTIMPPFGPAWRETSREDRQGYSFVTLIRG